MVHAFVRTVSFCSTPYCGHKSSVEPKQFSKLSSTEGSEGLHRRRQRPKSRIPGAGSRPASRGLLGTFSAGSSQGGHGQGNPGSRVGTEGRRWPAGILLLVTTNHEGIWLAEIWRSRGHLPPLLPPTLLQLMLPFVGDRHSVTEKEPGPKRGSAHSGLIPNNIPSTQF